MDQCQVRLHACQNDHHDGVIPSRLPESYSEDKIAHKSQVVFAQIFSVQS